jgi:hypothetical protein
MLRISLFGPPNRRIQPERYVPFLLNLSEIFKIHVENLLTKKWIKYKIAQED